MKIAYIANHNCGGNDDEGAISWALSQLGHEVLNVPERKTSYVRGCDFILFHHCNSIDKGPYKGIPKVFWWFDLVRQTDDTLRKRNRSRMRWMEYITPLVELGFMSDGDWVQKDTTGKLVHLFQGADSRITDNPLRGRHQSILFTGISRGGVDRESWVSEMKEKYDARFVHKCGVYRKALCQRISKFQITIAPDSPVTDLYWSNRVFMALGFGAFLLHPYCKMLASFYEDKKEIVFYRSREELHELIPYYMKHDRLCEEIRKRGYERTIAEHTYLHRCRVMVETVKERLGL